MSGCQGLGKEDWGITLNEHEVSFWGDESILEGDKSEGCTILCMKCH